MVTFETSADIAAGRDAVWQILSNVMSWGRWNPTVTKIEALDSSRLRTGNRFRVTQPKLRPAVWEATLVDPPSAFVWTSKSPGMTMIASHIVSEITPAQTKITLRFVFKGWVGVVVGRLVGGLVADYLAKESLALRFAVERDDHSTA